MKTAVVYYSKDGSTRVAAEAFAKKLDADIFELEEIKQRGSKPSAFMSAAFAALFGSKSRLKDTHTQRMVAYERICIGTPIWANMGAPAVNTFVDALDAAGKEMIIFTVQGDDTPNAAPAKGADRLVRKLEKKGASVKQIIRLAGAQPGNTVKMDAMNEQVSAKLVE